MEHIDARCARLAKTTLNLLNPMTHAIEQFQRGHGMHDYNMSCKEGKGPSAQLTCTKRAGGTVPPCANRVLREVQIYVRSRVGSGRVERLRNVS